MSTQDVLISYVGKFGYTTKKVLCKLFNKSSKRIEEIIIANKDILCVRKVPALDLEIIHLSDFAYDNIVYKYYDFPRFIYKKEKSIGAKILHEQAVQEVFLEIQKKLKIDEVASGFEINVEPYYHRKPDVIFTSASLSIALEIERTPKFGGVLGDVLRKAAYDIMVGNYNFSIWFLPNEYTAERYRSEFSLIDFSDSEIYRLCKIKVRQKFSAEEITRIYKSRFEFKSCNIL